MNNVSFCSAKKTAASVATVKSVSSVCVCLSCASTWGTLFLFPLQRYTLSIFGAIPIYSDFFLKTCYSNGAQTMDPDYVVGIGFRDVVQLFEVGRDEIGPALAQNTEDFGGLHPYLIIAIVQ